MELAYIIAGVSLLAIIGFIVWLWWISWSAPMGTETKLGLRIERPQPQSARLQRRLIRAVVQSSAAL
jgi:hypothetical protein